ncbi:MAG: hypothetical protein IT423_09530 [Pirellulaceae bacterium]|nr:hypothetical protein [Pirellulaceae bacterium]
MARALGTSRKAKSVAELPECFEQLWSADRELQGAAFQVILRTTEKPVSWADAALDEVFAQLTNKNNRHRSIAAQVLCNLAKSDHSERILRDFKQLFEVVKDERFVTARHALQSMWKVACVSERHRKKVLAAFEGWFLECVTHPNCTLIRYDILEGLRKLYDVAPSPTLLAMANDLIALEQDVKYQKKYRTLWPAKLNGGVP